MIINLLIPARYLWINNIGYNFDQIAISSARIAERMIIIQENKRLVLEIRNHLHNTLSLVIFFIISR